MMIRRLVLAVILAVGLAACEKRELPAPTALPSWNDTAPRAAILDFVHDVVSRGPDFVPPEQRVAVFDNDGTLWVEQPIYTEFAFAVERARALAKEDPNLLKEPAFAAIVSGDAAKISALTQADLLELIAVTHSGLTTEQFNAQATQFLAEAKHPRLDRRYTETVYRPMVELMDYLRANGFAVYIVSGGDADFVRTFSASAYHTPPQNVIGSANKTVLRAVEGGRFVLDRLPAIITDDGADKPANIELRIGAKPIFAAGNSDGDLEMLQYVTSGAGRRMGLLVHHDDEAREYAYDRHSTIGTLDKALDAARSSGWTIVSMKNDWRYLFPQAH